MNVLSPLTQKKERAQGPIAANALVGVLGSKGGAGATTLAVNLAAALSRSLTEELSVSLLDANFQQPDAALYLNCRPEHTLTELLSRAQNLEPHVVNACKNTVAGSQNLRLITPPGDGSAATRQDKGELPACLPHITAASAITVIDLPRQIDKTLVMLLDCCHVITLVVEPTVASIAATRRWLAAFQDLEYPQEKIILAANRLGSKAKLLETQLSTSFASYPLVKLPNAFKSIESSQIDGIPLVCTNSRDAYSKSINTLCREILVRLENGKTENNDHSQSEGQQ